MKEIELKKVTKIYSPNIMALEEVSLTIEQGEFVFLTGQSGCGKTTLLKLLSAQLMPTSGEVWARGHCTSELTHYQVPFYRRLFGIMQTDMGLLKEQTVRQNLEFAMYATEQPVDLTKRRVEQTLRTVGIPSKAGHYPHELSGGEAARALLARALVTSPKILVLDEPTANLDSSASWDLMCLVDEINRMGLTVIVASHDRELVTIMKKRVITFADGKLIGDSKRGVYDVGLNDASMARDMVLGRKRRNWFGKK